MRKKVTINDFNFVTDYFRLFALFLFITMGLMFFDGSPAFAVVSQSEQVNISFGDDQTNANDETEGAIQGKIDEDHIYWKGIPYAAAPVGDYRFMGPQPVTPWEGIKDTTEFGAKCHSGLTSKANTSEDCLFLNVYAPKEREIEGQSGLCPVIVFMHGGGYTYGSSNLYNGKFLVEKGYDGRPVVVVTINYRIGVFGFLYHSMLIEREAEKTLENKPTKSDDSFGNYGLRDQIKALEWVQLNISKFGGNPDNVTIMGQSAGAWSVITHLTSPLSAGLFHKAISQSGGPMVLSTEHAAILGNQLVDSDHMACNGGIQCLLDATPEEYAAIHEQMAADKEYAWYMPVMDGTLFTDHPFNILENGLQNDVPLMIGYNTEEAPPSIMVNISDDDPTTYNTAIQNMFLDVTDTDPSYDVASDILQFKNYYSQETWGGYKAALAQFQTDQFACQQIEVARLHSMKNNNVYMYYWHWPGSLEDQYPSVHIAELLFLFNEPGPLKITRLNMHNNMIKRWAKFAYDGDPWDDDWDTVLYEKQWSPFTTAHYDIYELGDRYQMRTRIPKAAISQNKSASTDTGCSILMNSGLGHFRYHWGGPKHMNADANVEYDEWINEMAQ